MKKIIKSLLVLLALFMSSINAVNAQNICDPDCIMEFTFTTGGTLTAVDEMRFTFAAGSELNLGATGTVNTAVQPSSLDFSNGGELILVAGESITFDSNGFLNMADGSNLDAISFSVTGGDLLISSSSSVSFSGAINIDGSLEIITPQITLEQSVVTEDALTLSNPNLGSSIVVAGAGEFTITPSTTITIQGALISDTGNTLTLNDISNSGAVNIIEAQPLDDLSILDGLEISALDGTLCTVNGNECIAQNGDIYILVEGKLVKQEGSSGSLNALSLLVMTMMLSLIRFRKFK